MTESQGRGSRLRINTTWPPPGRARRSALALAGVTAAAGTIMVLAAAGGGTVAGAAPIKAGVTLCHATAAVNQPYVTIHVAENSINQLIFGKNGHNSHTGPIFDPNGGKNQPVWGDIIPAFDWSGGHYDGLNVPAGQAILDNGCAFLTPETSTPPPPVTSEPPVSSPPASPSLGLSASSEVTSTTPAGPIPSGASAGLHTPVARAGLKAWGTVLLLLGGAGGLLAGMWPTRRRVH
jgi:hypothetical protein